MSENSLKIFFADADSTFLSNIGKRLSALSSPSIAWETCATGAELLQRIYAQPFDLVFMDMGLPDIGGLDLLNRLAHTSLPLPLVALSREKEPRLAVEAMRRGVLDFVHKDDFVAMDLGPFFSRTLTAFALKRENAELHQINHMKNDFLATISHELRTPLTSILGLAELLGSGRLGALNDRQGDGLTKIIEQSQNLSRLINQLLEVQDTAQQTSAGESVPIDLNDVIDRQINNLRSMFERKGVTLRSATPAERFFVQGNADALGKVVEHLLLNALKFTPQGGAVDVAQHSMPPKTVLFSVADTGQGIPKEALAFVFQKFFHADPSLTRAYGGLGLGLAYCQHTVESHGGRVWVESPGVGQGTTVNVTLPRVDAIARPQPSETPATTRTVLWVDDNPNMLELAEVGFTAFSSSVRLVTCQSGKAALEEASSSPPDLIVLDIMMPDMNGIEVLTSLKSNPRTQNIPVLIVTGYREAAREAVERGAADFFLKPFHLPEMLEKISKTLGLPSGKQK